MLLFSKHVTSHTKNNPPIEAPIRYHFHFDLGRWEVVWNPRVKFNGEYCVNRKLGGIHSPFTISNITSVKQRPTSPKCLGYWVHCVITRTDELRSVHQTAVVPD